MWGGGCVVQAHAEEGEGPSCSWASGREKTPSSCCQTRVGTNSYIMQAVHYACPCILSGIYGAEGTNSHFQTQVLPGRVEWKALLSFCVLWRWVCHWVFKKGLERNPGSIRGPPLWPVWRGNVLKHMLISIYLIINSFPRRAHTLCSVSLRTAEQCCQKNGP